MADPRVFTLIGNFDDNISKHLVAINQNLAKVKASLEEVSKATKPLKTDFRQLASLSQNFNTSLKSQASDIRDVTKAMRAMRNEMGRVNRAYRAGGRNAGQDARRFAPPPPPPPPRTPRFSTPPPPPPPRTPRYNVPEPPQPMPQRRPGYAAAAGATVGGAVLGTQLGDVITNAIVRGFQMGVSIMTVPFKYAANAFGERVRDEMSDLQSAGGLFATDLRYNLKMFQSFNEARRAQEDINARLAKSAAELPGETAQYVREAKRITDTMIGAMGRNQEAFMKYAQSVGAKPADKMDALATVIQKFTEKSVLLGMQPGGGGSRSIYGIPQLMEILVNQPNANLKSMSYRYAALRDNPLLANALQQGEAKINATAAGTAERLAAIMEILDQALPNEVVSAMRNSTDGVIQSIKSAFLDPEVGLFGLGRKLSGVVVPKVDALGRYLDKTGKVVEDVNLAADDQISLFGLFRDILAGFVVPLNGLIGILPQIYDPLKAIGVDMLEMRDISQRFLATFNGFTKGFEELGNKLKSYNIRSTASARGGLLTFANLLQNIGKIDTKQFQEYSRQLQDRNADLGKIAKSIFSELFDSKFMKMLGEMIGNIVGGTLKTLGDLMAGVTNMSQTGPFAEGLKKGWDASGGSQGIANIFKSLFRVIGDLIFKVITSAPMESAIVAGLFLLPSAISGLITAAITTVLTGGQSFMMNALRKAVMNIFKVKPVVVEDLGPRITDPRRQLPPAKGGAIVAQTTGSLVKFNKVLNSFMSYVKGIGPRFMGFFKGFLGKLSIFGAVITSVISLFQGKDLAHALAEGAGPLLGAALGSALIPFLGPIGPMLGAAVGGWIGSLESVTEPLAQAIQSVIDTVGTTFGLLGQIGSDLLGLVNGFIQTVFGVSKEFSALQLALTALLSPFRMLELLIIGLYEGYLRVKEQFLGLSKEEQVKKNELYQKRLERTAALELDFKQAYNKEARKVYQEELNRLRTSGKGNEERAKTVEKILNQIDTKLRQVDKNYKPPTSTYIEPKTAEQKLPKPNLWEQYSSWWTGNVNKFVEGVKSLPDNLSWLAGYAWQKTTEAWQGIQRAFKALGNWIVSLPGKLQSAVSKAVAGLQQAWNSLLSWFSKLPSQFSSKASSVGNSLSSGTQQIVNAIVNWAKSLPGRIVAGFTSGQQAARTPVGTRWDPKAKKTVVVYSDGTTSAAAEAYGSGNPFTGNLAQAVSFEQKNKPPGSDLVIANSSEMVIPAAGGYGVQDLLNTLNTGFSRLISEFIEFKSTQKSGFDRINQTLVSNQLQTNSRLSKLETKFTTPTGGLGGGSIGGGVDSFTSIAQRYGLQMTSGYRPGDPGWHGANRARDYSNGTGPTPQMMQFAQFLATNYGANLKELIYTPLGFSIKNGQKVPPIAAGTHYNHVHVAYAFGPRMPAFFGSQNAALQWERSMVPGSVKVGSVTANSAEGFGGETNVVNNITINQQPGQDTEELAAIVAIKIGEAIEDARAASLFV